MGMAVITGGTVFTMADGEEPCRASLVVEDGIIHEIIPEREAGLTRRIPSGAVIYDAEGMFVTPGFVDIHIHDEYPSDEPVVEAAMLSQGVTTGLSGNCGGGPLFHDSTKAHKNPMVNLYSLVGGDVLRAKAGQSDRYSPASPGQIGTMRKLLTESMELGAMGLSLGLEYTPGTSEEEIGALAETTAKFDGLISIHIRFDGDRCIPAVREAIGISQKHGVRVQISHLASMALFHTHECAELISSARRGGARVTFDAYPYSAFCTNIGSAVFDDGFCERWRGRGPENFEAVSGKFRGKWLNWDSFAEMRRDEPGGWVIAHVLDAGEVETCVMRPDCIVASDSFYGGEGIHPRTYGTFPRALGIMRAGGYNWNDALKKITSMPADVMGIPSGRLKPGQAADVAVFDPENFTDRATYHDAFAPPSGIKLVLVGGNAAVQDGKVLRIPRGRLCAAEKGKAL
jgi:N-acyl-D-amino-acid deacylase